MDSIKLQDAILRAVDTLASNRIDQLQMDKTVTAQIIRCTNALTREYRVSYAGGSIVAYAQEGQSYSSDQEVYVLIPQNDLTKRKIIIGKSQADNNGDSSNLSVISSAVNDYNVIGKNELVDNNNVQPAWVHSYLKEEYKVLYAHDQEDSGNYLQIDEQTFANDLKDAEAFMVRASFQTILPQSHKMSKTGDYGLEFVLAFKDQNNTDKANGDQPLTDGDGNQIVKYASYVIDSNTTMTGNPFRFNTITDQYQVFPIDAENFLYIDSIILYEKGFVDKDDLIHNREWNDGKGSINVRDVSFEFLRHITAKNGDYTLRLSMPYGSTFDFNTDQQTLTVNGSLTKGVQDLSDDTTFYWFRQDNRIVPEDANYQGAYGGAGWYWLKDKGSNKTLVTKGNENMAYENVYKVTAVYKSTLVLHETFTLYNNANSRKITIVSDRGERFSFDRGAPVLTCQIDGHSSNFDNVEKSDAKERDSRYRFFWARDDATSGLTVFNQSPEEMQKEYDDIRNSLKDTSSDSDRAEKVSRMRNLKNQIAQLDGVTWSGNTLTYPVKNMGNTATFECSVYYHVAEPAKGQTLRDVETNIGTASITLKNESAATPDSYYIVIENGNQVFQYSESGVSPDDERYKNPQEVKPLRCHFYDPSGEEVNSATYSLKWKVPLPEYEATMIVTPQEGMTVNPVNGKKEWYPLEEYPLQILGDYNFYANDNQVQAIVTYDGQEYTQYSNLTFTKVGENGTNGTDIVAKISPLNQGRAPINNDELLIMETNSNGGYQWNFAENAYATNRSGGALEFQLFQRSDEIIIKDPSDIKWSLYGGTGVNSKYLTISSDVNGNGIIEYQPITTTSGNTKYNYLSNKFRNQIARGQVTYDGNDYYCYYPLPMVEYNVDSFDKKQYTVHINDKDTLKTILYNADGRYPTYDKNQGISVKLIKVDENGNTLVDEDGPIEIDDKYIVWTVEGGQPDEEEFPNPSGQGYAVRGYELHPGKSALNLVYDRDNDQLPDPEINGGKKDLTSHVTLVPRRRQKTNDDGTIEDDGYENLTHVYILPDDVYDGECSNNVVHGKVYASKARYDAEMANPDSVNYRECDIYVPIYLSLNTYGLKSLNAWDGNHVEINTDENYILAPQVGAGEKDSANRFSGLVMGKATFYDAKAIDENGKINDDAKRGNYEDANSIGLVGYSHGKQSIFLDALTGNATFGLVEDNDSQSTIYDDKTEDTNATRTGTGDIRKYNEGRIELHPGGVSKIGGWRIGSRSLFNIIEDSDMSNMKDIDHNNLVSAYDDLRDKLEVDGKTKRYKTSIPHDSEGMLLSAAPAYLSIKGRMLKDSGNKRNGNGVNFLDANSLIKPYDSYELQLNPNETSIFTVYRHTASPRSAAFGVKKMDDGKYYVFAADDVTFKRPLSVATGEQPINGVYVHNRWRPITTDDKIVDMEATIKAGNRTVYCNGLYTNDKSSVKDCYIIPRLYLDSSSSDGFAHTAVTSQTVENGGSYSDDGFYYYFVAVNPDANGDNEYILPETIQDSTRRQEALEKFYTHFDWKRHSIVGIDSEGRFYTNAVKDESTAIYVGSIGAYGLNAEEANSYTGAAFEVGPQTDSEKLLKFFIRKQDEEDPQGIVNGRAYISGSSDPKNEYKRPLTMAFKDFQVYTGDKDSSLTTTTDKLVLSSDDADFGHFGVSRNNGKDIGSFLHLPYEADRQDKSGDEYTDIATLSSNTGLFVQTNEDTDTTLDTRNLNVQVGHDGNTGNFEFNVTKDYRSIIGNSASSTLGTDSFRFDTATNHIYGGTNWMFLGGNDSWSQGGLEFHHNTVAGTMGSPTDETTLWGNSVKIRANSSGTHGITLESHNANGIKLYAYPFGSDNLNSGVLLEMNPQGGGNASNFRLASPNASIASSNSAWNVNGEGYKGLSVTGPIVTNGLAINGALPGFQGGNASIWTSNRTYSSDFYFNGGSHKNGNYYVSLSVWDTLQHIIDWLQGLKNDLNTEITNRTNADNNLGTRITNEANARSKADRDEATTRANTDTSLSNRINSVANSIPDVSGFVTKATFDAHYHMDAMVPGTSLLTSWDTYNVDGVGDISHIKGTQMLNTIRTTGPR